MVSRGQQAFFHKFSPRQWDLLAVFFSSFAFYLNSACISYGVRNYPLTAGYFTIARSLTGFIMIPLILLVTLRRPEKPRYVGSLCMRALTHFVAFVAFFEATARLGSSLGNLLNLTYPLFLALFALGARQKQTQIFSTLLAALVAFAGMTLVLNPSADHPIGIDGLLIGLFSGATAAVSVANLKKAREANSPETVLLFLFGICLPLSLYFFWNEMYVPGRVEFCLLFFGSLAGVVGQYFFAFGARYISSTESGIVSQTRVVISAIAGQLLALEAPLSLIQYGGITLIMLVNVYLLKRKPAK